MSNVSSKSLAVLAVVYLASFGCGNDPGEATPDSGRDDTGTTPLDLGVGTVDGGEGCGDGTFGNGDSCTAWTTCGVGEFVETPGTATSDQVCAGCASGTFSSEENAASCETWTTCEAGTYVSTAGTESSDQECTP